ncbi:hypothetical protein [Pseudomonas indica]|uniref:hypothetical protein n=1 Tax=Pseudomonas indica TaxID=137658 RepID=UPI00111464FE|nr:hypothetical protein [Pseudomonas indica]
MPLVSSFSKPSGGLDGAEAFQPQAPRKRSFYATISPYSHSFQPMQAVALGHLSAKKISSEKREKRLT